MSICGIVVFQSEMWCKHTDLDSQNKATDSPSDNNTSQLLLHNMFIMFVVIHIIEITLRQPAWH